MKHTIIAFGLIISSILFNSCGFDADNKSSCTNQLCKGYWSEEYQGASLISYYGDIFFSKDGTCYWVGMGGHRINGTWHLGGVSGGTQRFREVDVKLDESLGNLGDHNFTMTLTENNNFHFLYVSHPVQGDGVLSQFNNDDKPI